MNLSQEALADKVFVTRQTISNWETAKSYPDIQSLLLLSTIFNISLDQLVKGDIKIMKEEIKKTEIEKLNKYGTIFAVLMVVLVLSVVPLTMWLSYYAIIPCGILFANAMFFALKTEKVKKENNVQTYKEIVAFCEGKRLDEIQSIQEKAKRPYQNMLKVIISAVITAVICSLIGLCMHFFLN